MTRKRRFSYFYNDGQPAMGEYKGKVHSMKMTKRVSYTERYCAECGRRIVVNTEHWVGGDGIHRLHMHCGRDNGA